jgi:hypothetical protein
MADHPDENLLAALIEGKLPPVEREAIEGHLATCAECRALVADVARETPAEPMAARRAYPWRIAAAVLLAAAAVFVFAPRDQPSAAEQLADAAHKLAEKSPDLFGAFKPLSETERLAPSDAVQRGGLVLLHPAGRTRDRVIFRWLPVTGATGYTIVLTKDDGDPVWERKAEPGLDATLAPGGYLWTVTAEGPLKEESTRHFEVAKKAEVARLDLALRAIAESAAPEVRDLLSAQYCIRMGFYGAAEPWARAAVKALPGEALATETLYCVLNLLGSPEVETLGIR